MTKSVLQAVYEKLLDASKKTLLELSNTLDQRIKYMKEPGRLKEMYAHTSAAYYELVYLEEKYHSKSTELKNVDYVEKINTIVSAVEGLADVLFTDQALMEAASELSAFQQPQSLAHVFSGLEQLLESDDILRYASNEHGGLLYKLETIDSFMLSNNTQSHFTIQWWLNETKAMLDHFTPMLEDMRSLQEDKSMSGDSFLLSYLIENIDQLKGICNDGIEELRTVSSSAVVNTDNATETVAGFMTVRNVSHSLNSGIEALNMIDIGKANSAIKTLYQQAGYTDDVASDFAAKVAQLLTDFKLRGTPSSRPDAMIKYNTKKKTQERNKPAIVSSGYQTGSQYLLFKEESNEQIEKNNTSVRSTLSAKS